MVSGSDYWKHYRRCTRVVRKTVPDFIEFFDSLRMFIGCSTWLIGRWREGDSWHKKSDMGAFNS